MFFRNKKRKTRTLSGDTEKSRSVYRNGKMGAKFSRTSNILEKIIFWLGALGFVGVVFYSLFFATFLSIDRIEISGTEDINPELIRQAAAESASGKYLNIVSKNNLMLLNKKALMDGLLEKFHKLDAVTVEKNFPHTLKISLAEKHLVLRLCGQERCFFVDEGGMGYAESDFGEFYDWADGLLRLTDENDNLNDTNFFPVEKDYLEFVLSAEKKLKEDLDIEIECECRTKRLISGDVIFKTKEGWEALLNKDVNLQKTIDILRASLNNQIGREKRQNLEYIDLRTDNKVYYKTRN